LFCGPCAKAAPQPNTNRQLIVTATVRIVFSPGYLDSTRLFRHMVGQDSYLWPQLSHDWSDSLMSGALQQEMEENRLSTGQDRSTGKHAAEWEVVVIHRTAT